MKRVVVTGIGALTPIGNGINAYLKGLQEGISGANIITLFDASNFKTQFACELKDFNVGDYMDVREARRLDRFTVLAVIAADEAMENSGLDIEKIDPDRAGVIWGAGIGGLSTLEKEVEDYITGNGTPRYNPFMIPKMIPDIAAGQISIKYGMRGLTTPRFLPARLLLTPSPLLPTKSGSGAATS